MKFRVVVSSFPAIILLLLPLAYSADTDAPLPWSFQEYITSIFGHTRNINNNPPEKGQDILLIGAGLSRTGTSSFSVAAKRIGLKSYHMPAVTETAGHVKLWKEHIQALKEGIPKGTADKVMDAFFSEGFNSTGSMPACFLYKDLMERYPSARVVLTVRGDGDGRAWAKSVKESIGLKAKLIMWRVPFRWMPISREFRESILPFIFGNIGARIDGNTGELDAEELARGYNTWVEKVRATVPPERLLVFSPQDGWEPLCEFLSPISDDIKESCAEIIASGELYPRVNDGAAVRRIVPIIVTITAAFEKGPFIALGMAILWWLVTKKSKANKNKNE